MLEGTGGNRLPVVDEGGTLLGLVCWDASGRQFCVDPGRVSGGCDAPRGATRRGNYRFARPPALAAWTAMTNLGLEAKVAPTTEELVARAAGLRERLHAESDAAEERGGYSPEMHQAFVDAGFYRMLQPRMFGGYEMDLADYFRVIIEIGRGDPQTGWALCLAAGHAFQIGAFFSERAQTEIFGIDGDVVIPSRAVPGGTATRVDGGWQARRHVGLLLGRDLRDARAAARADAAARRTAGAPHGGSPARGLRDPRRLGRRAHARPRRHGLELDPRRGRGSSPTISP